MAAPVSRKNLIAEIIEATIAILRSRCAIAA
jgi:hypothetical protein